MSKSVFVTRKFPGDGLNILKKMYKTEVWPHDEPPSKEDIGMRAKDVDGLITLLSDSIDGQLIRGLANLKIIAQYAVGYDNIDVEAATERGIIVTNTPDVLTETTADLAWALIMSTARRIVEAHKYVENGRWQVGWGPNMLVGTDVYGSTLGIVGMGRIGSSVTLRSSGFDMKVLYTTRTENKYTKMVENKVQAERVDLQTLLKEADFISIHVPLTDETKNMIGYEELISMKKGAFLINTSRGAVIDEKALVRVLKENHLGGVGLDVFEQEPTPATNVLLTFPNVVVLPHIGSASNTTRTKMGDMCVENLIKALSGEKPPNIVNPEVL